MTSAPGPMIEALMLGTAFGLGGLVGWSVWSLRFPKGLSAWGMGIALVGWVVAFVSALFLGDRDPESRPQPTYVDWRGMEYIDWVHPLCICLGFLTVVAILWRVPHASLRSDLPKFKAMVVVLATLLVAIILINTIGFLASLTVRNNPTALLPMVGMTSFVSGLFGVVLGGLRNLLIGDGPGWLRGDFS